MFGHKLHLKRPLGPPEPGQSTKDMESWCGRTAGGFVDAETGFIYYISGQSPYTIAWVTDMAEEVCKICLFKSGARLDKPPEHRLFLNYRKYLDPALDDPSLVYKDMEVKERPSVKFPDSMKGDWVLCHICQGHGGWNLVLDSYGEGKHFQCWCSQCWGWGWVELRSKDHTCAKHKYHELSQRECRERGIEHWGMCWHVDECEVCGNIVSYDSSG